MHAGSKKNVFFFFFFFLIFAYTIVLCYASWRYNPFWGKPDTVMQGSNRNVVELTRTYALPLTALFWARIPDLRSMTSLVISLFKRLAHFRQLVSAIYSM
jgi:hypothetical protein